MFKQSIFLYGVLFFVGLATIGASSPRQTYKRAMTSHDASLAKVFISELMHSVDTANIDFQMTGSIDSKKGLQYDLMKGTGILKFKSDWNIPLNQKNNSSSNTASSGADDLEKVIPTLIVDAKDLIATVRVNESPRYTDMTLHFYKGFEESRKRWIPRPLTLSASNQFNKELIKIKFNWVKLQIQKSNDSEQPSLIKGTCSSSKETLDILTGDIHEIEVQCEFEGIYSKDDYNLNFKYLNENGSPHLPPQG